MLKDEKYNEVLRRDATFIVHFLCTLFWYMTLLGIVSVYITAVLNVQCGGKAPAFMFISYKRMIRLCNKHTEAKFGQTDSLIVTEGDKMPWLWRTALEWNVGSPHAEMIQEFKKSQVTYSVFGKYIFFKKMHWAQYSFEQGALQVQELKISLKTFY